MQIYESDVKINKGFIVNSYVGAKINKCSNYKSYSIYITYLPFKYVAYVPIPETKPNLNKISNVLNCLNTFKITISALSVSKLIANFLTSGTSTYTFVYFILLIV